jgi:RNA recognition motif-containing protein
LSETILFVGNLPFAVDDEALRLIFDEDNVKKTQVIFGFNKRSKGFGFAEFKTAEDCTNALEKFQKAELDGRTLLIRKAFADVSLEEK